MRRPSVRRTAATVACLTTLTLALTACSGDEATTTADAVEQVSPETPAPSATDVAATGSPVEDLFARLAADPHPVGATFDGTVTGGGGLLDVDATLTGAVDLTGDAPALDAVLALAGTPGEVELRAVDGTAYVRGVEALIGGGATDGTWTSVDVATLDDLGLPLGVLAQSLDPAVLSDLLAGLLADGSLTVTGPETQAAPDGGDELAAYVVTLDQEALAALGAAGAGMPGTVTMRLAFDASHLRTLAIDALGPDGTALLDVDLALDDWGIPQVVAVPDDVRALNG